NDEDVLHAIRDYKGERGLTRTAERCLQRLSLDLSTETDDLLGGDIACLRFAGREVIDGRALQVRGGDCADKHRDREGRDQQYAPRSDSFKHRARAER